MEVTQIHAGRGLLYPFLANLSVRTATLIHTEFVKGQGTTERLGKSVKKPTKGRKKHQTTETGSSNNMPNLQLPRPSTQ